MLIDIDYCHKVYKVYKVWYIQRFVIIIECKEIFSEYHPDHQITHSLRDLQQVSYLIIQGQQSGNTSFQSNYRNNVPRNNLTTPFSSQEPIQSSNNAIPLPGPQQTANNIFTSTNRQNNMGGNTSNTSNN